MAIKPLRSDFASASVGLTMSRQRRHLEDLHDWLLDELSMGDQETVIALTNYQEGRFGHLPEHILIVTTQRVAYTHHGGMRSVPLDQLNTGRLGLKAGIANGELTLVTSDGEVLNFRRGMSLGMQEVAAAIQAQGNREPREAASPQPSQPAPAKPPSLGDSAGDARPATDSQARPQQASEQTDLWSNSSDAVIQFEEPLDGLQAFRARSSGGFAFSIWSLSAALSEQQLLVNTTKPYAGVVLAGVAGPYAGFKVSAAGPWALTAGPG